MSSQAQQEKQRMGGEKKEENNTTPPPVGKGEGSRGEKAMSELSLTERIVEHDGWPGDMMEGVMATVNLRKLNWATQESM
ncbi:hypothetical protein N7449_007096 [Penicillium cf. viridicatum]|uniref:Uncharacterized protein n=1 Tax=Penicillium cf. viridicatum TaxID=2972119 RepID=A0A9W9JII1_9EURO|nr:hypothetical protein N7449_007096 [Penicillium cf. viridicatum]